jgi:hypothetical protein
VGEGEEGEVAMLPIIKLSQAWAEREGFSDAIEAASFFDLDLAGAVLAGEGDKCPKCTRHCAEYRISVFVPDSATATASTGIPPTIRWMCVNRWERLTCAGWQRSERPTPSRCLRAAGLSAATRQPTT